MRAVVVYESMYGNTRVVADAVGRGLAAVVEVEVVPVDRASRAVLGTSDLLVVGGPTHAHGMSRSATRQAAVDAAAGPESGLHLDAGAGGAGLRDWFAELGRMDVKAAAFDIRVDMPAALSGRAAKGIHRELRHHGFELVDEPESFLVDRANHLEAGEAARAQAWGEHLARVLVPAAPAPVAPPH
jgi:hypothetical protein